MTAAAVRDAAEIERAIDQFAGKPNGGLVVLPSGPIEASLGIRDGRIAAIAAEHLTGVETLDASGNVYVSLVGNTIEKYSPTGVDLGVFANTGLQYPWGLAFDK